MSADREPWPGSSDRRPPQPGPHALFAERDGCFAPLALEPTPFALGLRARVQSLGLPAGVSIFLRGSRLEDPSPHPAADVDLVVVVDAIEESRAAWHILKPWAGGLPHPVDLTPYSTVGVAECAAIRLLLATRSLHLTGPALALAPVPANLATMAAHARRYAPERVEPQLSPRRPRRVCELKQLTRSFGVWRRLAGGPFSRDVATCLAFADELAPASGRILRAAWEALPDCPDVDVSTVQRELATQPIFVRVSSKSMLID